jgi:uncharacterized protein YfaT (DUF1175 family)
VGDCGGIPFAPAFDSIAKYQYPYTPLGASLFRVKRGAVPRSDLSDGTFLPVRGCANAAAPEHSFVGRDLARARPGDLLFFRQESATNRSFHSMIYLGESVVRPGWQSAISSTHTVLTDRTPARMRRLRSKSWQHFRARNGGAREATPDFSACPGGTSAMRTISSYPYCSAAAASQD